MKLKIDGGITETEYRKMITEFVMNKNGIPKEDRKLAKEYIPIKREISALMLEQLKGLPQPIKKRGRMESREAERMMREYGPPTYSKKLKTDSQKLNYLIEEISKNAITQEVFIDLSSVLKAKIKKDQAHKIIRFE